MVILKHGCVFGDAPSVSSQGLCTPHLDLSGLGNRSGSMWLPRLSHRRPSRFHFAHRTLACGGLIHHAKPSDDSEATMLWRGTKSMERPYVGALVNRSQLSLESFQSRCQVFEWRTLQKIPALHHLSLSGRGSRNCGAGTSHSSIFCPNYWLKILEYNKKWWLF